MISHARRTFAKTSATSTLASIEEAARNTTGFSDFRSDTVTRPCVNMRHAMAHAVVGDDVFKDCPTTKALERRVADIFGKEDALFVPTGTMSNLISAKLMTLERARSLIVGSKTHLVNYERGGMASLGHIFPLILENEVDGTIPLEKIEAALPKVVDPHVVPVSGISLESSHNVCNGRVLRSDYISAVKKIMKKKKMMMHLDGARVWNASIFLGVDLKDYTKDFDLISACLSKGMGCPAGSLIIGSHKDMVEARNMRKMLGGGMRQSGVLAACGMVSLNDW
jgi:threonine aldolase